MRSDKEKSDIISRLTPTTVLKNIVDSHEIADLHAYYQDKGDHYVEKKTGPKVASLVKLQSYPTVLNIINRIKQYIGEFDTWYIQIYTTEVPYIIHSDDNTDINGMHKAIVIPIAVQYNTEVPEKKYPNVITFDQYYLDGGAKFFKGETFVETHAHKCIYEYSEVQNLSSTHDTNMRLRTGATHLKEEWTEGLSVENIIPFVPGDAIVFDSVRLHCTSNFRTQDIKSIIGMSIFTKL